MNKTATRNDSAGRLLLEDAEDFFFAHDEEVFAIELDLGAGVLAEEDGVASLDVEREDLAFVVGLALAFRRVPLRPLRRRVFLCSCLAFAF